MLWTLECKKRWTLKRQQQFIVEILMPDQNTFDIMKTQLSRQLCSWGIAVFHSHTARQHTIQWRIHALMHWHWRSCHTRTSRSTFTVCNHINSIKIHRSQLFRPTVKLENWSVAEWLTNLHGSVCGKSMRTTRVRRTIRPNTETVQHCDKRNNGRISRGAVYSTERPRWWWRMRMRWQEQRQREGWTVG